MPARPISDETLQLIDAVRNALAHRSDVEERPLFGTHAFFVDSKMCIAVKGEELLVRLPPERHSEIQELENTRDLSPDGKMQGYFWVEPNGYATRAQWSFWIDEVLAYNPRAKTSPRKRPATSPPTSPTPAKPAGTKRHSVFNDDS